jgi:hypothetical protein
MNDLGEAVNKASKALNKVTDVCGKSNLSKEDISKVFQYLKLNLEANFKRSIDGLIIDQPFSFDMELLKEPQEEKTIVQWRQFSTEPVPSRVGKLLRETVAKSEDVIIDGVGFIEE